MPVTARNADLIFTSTPFEVKTWRWPKSGHNVHGKKLAKRPNFNRWPIVFHSAGYVVSYLQASKERGRAKGFGRGL
jgi:hypothetical protein